LLVINNSYVLIKWGKRKEPGGGVFPKSEFVEGDDALAAVA
jgi:hypothetical protein